MLYVICLFLISVMSCNVMVLSEGFGSDCTNGSWLLLMFLIFCCINLQVVSNPHQISLFSGLYTHPIVTMLSDHSILNNMICSRSRNEHQREVGTG